MTEFVMLIGIPGSGKSTCAEQLEKHGYHVHSSDSIREELTGNVNSQDKNSSVFDILHKRVKEDLSNGVSCVYDATNINMKRRKAFLDEIKKYDCFKICIVFAFPVDICKEQNRNRDRKVPDFVFDKMLRQFQCPYYYEGWDHIFVVGSKDHYKIPFDSFIDFKQDNPHHKFTLYEHLKKASEYAKNKKFGDAIEKAAKYHDCGKFFTKSFLDSKGNKSDIAHYYGHENYSAYIYLCETFSLLSEPIVPTVVIYIACLINWHMRPYTAWMQSEKARQRDIELIGVDMYEDIMKLHEADAHAH